MSVVSLLNVDVQNNPASITEPYEFIITFECLEPLQKDLEWKLIYVGSATSSEHDQVLDSIDVGPIPVGVNKFAFEANAPDLKKIPDSEILGVTVMLLTCAYDGREFVRVGYYVNNEYTDEALNSEPPAKPIVEKVRRNILADKPRVTRFAIKWDSEESAPPEFPPDQPEADLAEDDGAAYGAEEDGEEEQQAEEVEGEAAPELVKAPENGEDTEMAGAEDTKDEVASEAGSEDLEAPSEGSDEEDDEEEDDEEEGEGEGGDADEKMDTTDGAAAQPADVSGTAHHPPQSGPDVMVH